jgi:hypothetical protein
MAKYAQERAVEMTADEAARALDETSAAASLTLKEV